MKTNSFLVTLLLCAVVSIQAQNDADALRYSMLQYGSTARALGVGGAFGAIGGDFGSISINPAGLGVYRSSELQFSPGFSVTGTNSDYLGASESDSRTNANVGSAGFVFTDLNEMYRTGSGLRLVSTSFAFGVNRLASFSSGRTFEGYNNQNSLLDSYAEYLNFGSGTPPADAFDADPFCAGLAYDAFLLNPLPGDSNQYYTVIPSGDVWQQQRLIVRGSVTEMVIAMGANFGHKLYVGGSIGVPFVKYVERNNYSETDRDQAIDDFVSYEQESRLNTRGTGINAKFGLLIRPVEAVRIGASIHSPTRYRLRDEYTSEIFSDLESSTYDVFSPLGLFDYTLRTPWRVNGSLGILLSDKGFLSFDYEYLDYGLSEFDFSRSGIGFSSAADGINTTISSKYTSAHNLRGGVEVNAEPFRFRLGYGYLSTPFAEGRATGDADLSRQSFSGGIGYRGESVYIDLAYVHSITKFVDVPYQLSDPAALVPFAVNDQTMGTAVLTMGLRF